MAAHRAAPTAAAAAYWNRRSLSRVRLEYEQLQELASWGESLLRRGYGWTTLQRVANRLHIQKIRQGGWGGHGWWAWRLPDEHPLRTGEAEPDADQELSL